MIVVDIRPTSAVPRSAAALRPEAVLPLHARFRRTTDPLLETRPWSSVGLAGKRAFDILASLLLLLGLSPLFLLVIVAIPLESPGPAFFRHDRIGLHGRTFRIFKFRTMRRDAHAKREAMVGTKDAKRLLFKSKKDPRVTKLGHLLRKYSIDELPQLLNVLRGEMSLIGPRPLLKEDFQIDGLPDALYLQWLRDRHSLWPGITGLWQVSGRSELSFEDSMRADLAYVTRWSPWLDVKILVKTPLAVLQGKGAY